MIGHYTTNILEAFQVFMGFYASNFFTLTIDQRKKNSQKDDISFCTILRIKYYFAKFLSKKVSFE